MYELLGLPLSTQAKKKGRNLFQNAVQGDLDPQQTNYWAIAENNLLFYLTLTMPWGVQVKESLRRTSYWSISVV